MANSSIEEPCSDIDKRPPGPRPTAARQETLQRMGSGASVVIDPEGGTEAESRKLPSSKYKGVVPQPNGRWGAQIYEKHQRVWLGTFNEEAEAAHAYDVAVQRFRGRDAVTNFKPLEPESDDNDAAELAFITSHSKAEVVDMLRKHTYNEELQQNRRSLGGGIDKRTSSAITDLPGNARGELSAGAVAPSQREQLFDKAVTPSDVGKLNRLVIPKQHAEKYFPLQHVGGAACKGVLLNFEERCGKVWRFRYSYWNSSQSYVLTKGWSRFVKEKGLKTGDVVAFHRSLGPEKKLFIDWKRRAVPTEVRTPTAPPTVEVVRLFGVNIVKVPTVPAAELDVNGGVVGWVQGKRCRDHVEHSMPPSQQESFKRHCKEASY